MTTGHLDDSLFQRNLILDLAHKLNLGDLGKGNFFLYNYIFESENGFHYIVIFDPLVIELQHHLFWRECAAYFGIDELLELAALESGVDICVV